MACFRAFLHKQVRLTIGRFVYVRLFTMAENLVTPELWEAIRTDNTGELDQIMSRNEGRAAQEWLEARDEENKDIIQAAARANSPRVVERLLEILFGGNRELFLDYLKIGERKSALHVAVESKSHSVIHQLLKPLSREEQEQVLELRSDGESAEDVARRLQDEIAVTVIQSKYPRPTNCKHFLWSRFVNVALPYRYEVIQGHLSGAFLILDWNGFRFQ